MNLVAKVGFMKMSTPQQKAQCVFCFIETKSDIQAQRNFRRKYEKKPSARPTIRAWHKKFMETGSVLQRKGADDAGQVRFRLWVFETCLLQ